MKFVPNSLRLRLLILILLPIIIVAILLGFWRYEVAKDTAQDVFDRTLLSTALAIARDVAITEGDALQPSTRDLIANATGGEVFYHVMGPNGAYVTGYAYPPVRERDILTDQYGIRFSHADYRGEPVRMVAIESETSTSNIHGLAIVRVWQRVSERQIFAHKIGWRAISVLSIMLCALAGSVWIGVQIGLRPLDDLQDAINKRSSDDLSPIQRRVPREVQGVVGTLNGLFEQVRTSLTAHQNFISDAAHQLKNPVAATLALAEALSNSKNISDQNQAMAELLKAARHSSRTTTQLLSLERISNPAFSPSIEQVELSEILKKEAQEFGDKILKAGKNFDVNIPNHEVMVMADPVLLGEAVKNLLTNALVHGGSDSTIISLALQDQRDVGEISVENDGNEFAPEDRNRAFERFSQLSPGQGSGLGLSIVQAAMEKMNGSVNTCERPLGAKIQLIIPKN